jgi:hypothetical protein
MIDVMINTVMTGLPMMIGIMMMTDVVTISDALTVLPHLMSMLRAKSANPWAPCE